MLFAVPAMAMFTYGRITERLDSPTGSIAQTEQEKPEKTATAKQGSDTPPTPVIPVSQTVIDNTPVKQSLSMLSESVDWS
ncbi:hypothetical protein [Nitrosomonas oligotropha]|uniref:hypothetical protein n=1 Tax=Nitrosomonas oligotropha TaxID=42354 RepID=UPI001370FAC6|nr:hypothetical protein [Nitrosomonas oligotropha]MXS82026.1 hypothetical protein [Nitrosomonas oligotropha]